MLPPFDPTTGNLPPGIHSARWEELVERYGFNAHRRRQISGLKDALLALQAAGCRRVYVDGSFVSKRELPGDFDACWDVEGVDLRRLDPVLMTFDERRAAQKRRFGGELFPMGLPANTAGATFLEFFQRDRETNQPKGIVMLELGDLTP
jgi:hypothetical protein